MKKLIAILLIPVFLLMTAGVAITSLYCNGKVSDVGINVQACCKDVNKGGCCDTKTQVVKVQDSFVNYLTSFEFNKFLDLDLPVFRISYVSEAINVTHFKTFWDKAPPLVKGDLYILFRSLII